MNIFTDKFLLDLCYLIFDQTDEAIEAMYWIYLGFLLPQYALIKEQAMRIVSPQ